MRTLAKFVVPAILAGLAMGAAPAEARTPARANAIRVQINQLENRVQRNDWRDRISEREARALRQDIRQLKWQFRNYNRNGLSNYEMNALERRIRSIRADIRWQRWDGNRHRR